MTDDPNHPGDDAEHIVLLIWRRLPTIEARSRALAALIEVSNKANAQRQAERARVRKLKASRKAFLMKAWGNDEDEIPQDQEDEGRMAASD